MVEIQCVYEIRALLMMQPHPKPLSCVRYMKHNLTLPGLSLLQADRRRAVTFQISGSTYLG